MVIQRYALGRQQRHLPAEEQLVAPHAVRRCKLSPLCGDQTHYNHSLHGVNMVISVI